MSERYQGMSIVQAMCHMWVERASALGLKGKKRDDECLAYFIGGAVACTLTGQDNDAALLNAFAAFGVAYRGHMAVTHRLAVEAGLDRITGKGA